MDSGEKRKQQQSFLILRKRMTKSTVEKTREQLENLRIQGRMIEFIRELIGKRWIKVRVGRSIL